MRQIADFAQAIAEKVLDRTIIVKFCATPHHLGAASYGPSGDLVFNKLRLGSEWFERGITEDVVQLLVHEFGHQFSSDHLSSEYHEALCALDLSESSLIRISIMVTAIGEAVTHCTSMPERPLVSMPLPKRSVEIW